MRTAQDRRDAFSVCAGGRLKPRETNPNCHRCPPVLRVRSPVAGLGRASSPAARLRPRLKPWRSSQELHRDQVASPRERHLEALERLEPLRLEPRSRARSPTRRTAGRSRPRRSPRALGSAGRSRACPWPAARRASRAEDHALAASRRAPRLPRRCDRDGDLDVTGEPGLGPHRSRQPSAGGRAGSGRCDGGGPAPGTAARTTSPWIIPTVLSTCVASFGAGCDARTRPCAPSTCVATFGAGCDARTRPCAPSTCVASFGAGCDARTRPYSSFASPSPRASDSARPDATQGNIAISYSTPPTRASFSVSPAPSTSGSV
jgi:hypothetical protein